MSPNTWVPEIVVAVGTDHHPFDRLIEWVDDYLADGPNVSVLVQRGTARPSSRCESVDLLHHGELCERFAGAVAVVSHGGPSTVMDARLAGRLPIVVPRNPALGEHVDDHQLRFARHLGRHGLATVAEDRGTLHRLLDEAVARPDLFTVAVQDGSIPGVLEFGRAVDGLLGTVTTPPRVEPPAGVADGRTSP